MASVIQNYFGGGKPKFHPKKCELSLKLALNRMNIHKNKKIEECMRLKREIHSLLEDGKLEAARVKVTGVIFDDYSIEVFNLMESYCQAIITRMDVIDVSRTCPDELQEAVCSVVYTAPFLESDAKFGEPELMKVRAMFLDKYGKNFQLECSTSGCINPKLVRDLSGKIPAESLIDFYLESLGSGKNLQWETLLNHQPVSSSSNESNNNSLPFPQFPTFDSAPQNNVVPQNLVTVTAKILKDSDGNTWGKENGNEKYIFISPNDRNNSQEGDKVEIQLHPRTDGAKSGVVSRILERDIGELQGNLMVDESGHAWIITPTSDPLFVLPEDLNQSSNGDSVSAVSYLRGDGKTLGRVKQVMLKFKAPKEFQGLLQIDNSGNFFSESPEGPLFISPMDLQGAEKGDRVLVLPNPRILPNSPPTAKINAILEKAPKEFQAKFAVDDNGNRWLTDSTTPGKVLAFVSPSDSSTALHGDLVSALLNPSRPDGKSTGKVLNILHRAQQPKEIVAKILVDENSNKWAEETPGDKNLIFIPNSESSKGIQNGDKALVRVFPPRPDGKSIGQVISVLEAAQNLKEKVGILRVDNNKHTWFFSDVKEDSELDLALRNGTTVAHFVPQHEMNGGGHGDQVKAFVSTSDGKNIAKILEVVKSAQIELPPPVSLPQSSFTQGEDYSTTSKVQSSSNSNRFASSAIVLDIGSGVLKAGIAGEDKPRTAFKNVVGRPLYRSVMSRDDWSELYVGEEAVQKKGVLKLSFPMERGVVQHWDDLEAILTHTFMNELRVDPSEHAVMITEGPMEPKANREKLFEILFDRFGVPAVHVAMRNELALYASGRTTGVVLDIGDGVALTVPTFQGYTVDKGVGRLDLAGKDLTDYLAVLLTEKGFSASSSSAMHIVQDVKEKLGYVAKDPSGEVATETQYSLPDGRVLSVGNERHRCVEPLFQPSLLGKDVAGVQHMLYKTVMSCDVDVRKELFGNVILSGGSTLFPGFKQRLESEVQSLVGGSMRVNVTAPEDRLYSVWSGGSVLASLPAFDQWVTKEEYREFGKNVVHRNRN